MEKIIEKLEAKLKSDFNAEIISKKEIDKNTFYIDADGVGAVDKEAYESDLQDGNVVSIYSISGAYIDGDSENKMVTRISVWVFDNENKYDEFIQKKSAEKEGDHRTIGKNLGLFTFSKAVGKGLPLYTEKGAAIKRVLERLVVDEEMRRGYKHVSTPDITKKELYEKSGHLEKYSDDMYNPIQVDDEEFILRPMTCPHHFELYLSEPRSYRDLPMRIAEISKLYRYEKSGQLTGLLRVRSFCLSDAHIICENRSQATEEVKGALDLIKDINSKLGFKEGEDYWFRLSLGNKSDGFEGAEECLRSALKDKKINFVEAIGEATFYGPKIDIQISSSSGKEDTAFTVQWDEVMAGKFDMTYIGSDGKKHQPIIIHRSSIGSVERIMAFLIEKYKGSFPFFISPTQVSIINVSDSSLEYAKKFEQSLREKGIRTETDFGGARLGQKLKKAKLSLTPYIAIVGDKDADENKITLESRSDEKIELDFEKAIEKLVEENSI